LALSCAPRSKKWIARTAFDDGIIRTLKRPEVRAPGQPDAPVLLCRFRPQSSEWRWAEQSEAVSRPEIFEAVYQVFIGGRSTVHWQAVVEEAFDPSRREQHQHPRFACRAVFEAMRRASRHKDRLTRLCDHDPAVDVNGDLTFEHMKVFILGGVSMERRAATGRLDGYERKVASLAFFRRGNDLINATARTKANPWTRLNSH